MANPIPEQIDKANLICYLILSDLHTRTGNTKHWREGQLIETINRLAICNYANGSGYYLFYCDQNWTTLNDSYHETIAEAKKQAEFEYSNTMNSWVNASIS